MSKANDDFRDMMDYWTNCAAEAEKKWPFKMSECVLAIAEVAATGAAVVDSRGEALIKPYFDEAYAIALAENVRARESC